MELRGFFAVSISKKGQFIQPHATSVLSWDFIILVTEFCEMSFTDGACRQCFIQSLQLKTKHFSFYMQSNLRKCKALGRVTQGLFPLSRNFSVRMHVKFRCVNEIEAMYERSQVSVKVEPRSTFTLTRESPHIASILFTRVKLRDSGNQPLRKRRSSLTIIEPLFAVEFIACNF